MKLPEHFKAKNMRDKKLTMKITLYMAISVNGFIAKPSHNTPWTEEEFESYSNKVKEVGNLIIGKTTFDLMYEKKIFTDLDEPFVVVLTSSEEKPPREKTVYVKTFEDAVKTLRRQGFSSLLVGGGGQTDTAALESGMIEELYVDVEPLVFGEGIPLFSSSETNLKLKLVDTKRIGASGMQLHYQVLK